MADSIKGADQGSVRGRSMTDREARKQLEEQSGLKGDATEREVDLMRGKLPPERGGLLMD